MLEFIALGGALFWITTAVWLIALFIAIDKENGWWATVSLVVYFLVLAIFGSFDLTGFLFANPLMIGIILLGYFAIGLIWSFMRWGIHVRVERAKFDDFKAEWLESKGIQSSTVPEELQSEWTAEAKRYARKCLGRKYSGEDTPVRSGVALETGTQILDAIRPKVRRNKSTIIFWMAYWPISFLWTMLNDFVMGIWNAIYHGVGKRMQAMSDRQFKDIDTDFKS